MRLRASMRLLLLVAVPALIAGQMLETNPAFNVTTTQQALTVNKMTAAARYGYIVGNADPGASTVGTVFEGFDVIDASHGFLVAYSADSGQNAWVYPYVQETGGAEAVAVDIHLETGDVVVCGTVSNVAPTTAGGVDSSFESAGCLIDGGSDVFIARHKADTGEVVSLKCLGDGATNAAACVDMGLTGDTVFVLETGNLFPGDYGVRRVELSDVQSDNSRRGFHTNTFQHLPRTLAATGNFAIVGSSRGDADNGNSPNDLGVSAYELADSDDDNIAEFEGGVDIRGTTKNHIDSVAGQPGVVYQYVYHLTEVGPPAIGQHTIFAVAAQGSDAGEARGQGIAAGPDNSVATAITYDSCWQTVAVAVAKTDTQSSYGGSFQGGVTDGYIDFYSVSLSSVAPSQDQTPFSVADPLTDTVGGLAFDLDTGDLWVARVIGNSMDVQMFTAINRLTCLIWRPIVDYAIYIGAAAGLCVAGTGYALSRRSRADRAKDSSKVTNSLSAGKSTQASKGTRGKSDAGNYGTLQSAGKMTQKSEATRKRSTGSKNSRGRSKSKLSKGKLVGAPKDGERTVSTALGQLGIDVGGNKRLSGGTAITLASGKTANVAPYGKYGDGESIGAQTEGFYKDPYGSSIMPSEFNESVAASEAESVAGPAVGGVPMSMEDAIAAEARASAAGGAPIGEHARGTLSPQMAGPMGLQAPGEGGNVSGSGSGSGGGERGTLSPKITAPLQLEKVTEGHRASAQVAPATRRRSSGKKKKKHSKR